MDRDELLKKWLSDDLNQEEAGVFQGLEDYDLNQEILEGAQQFKAPEFSSNATYEVLKTKLKASEEKPVIKLNAFKVISRIAAVFIIGLGVYFTFFSNNLTTIETLAANQTTFELPDASSVTLNASSTIAYSKNKWSDKREVKLEGEAYFKVAKGSKFDVITDAGIVSVLGTQFTVNNREDYYEVKCFEGIVSVTTNNTTEKLTKGKTLRLTRKKITLGVIVNEEPNWINNKSSFNSVPLYEVLKELERQYNVSIDTENVNLEALFTGGFVNNNIEQALKSITIPLDLSIKKNNSTKITLYK